jgi:dipeptidyl aminopeptidase/acylaminoacyl peptidase
MTRLSALIALASIGASTITLADSDWPYPGDIPDVPTVTVGLAGEYPADVVRYLLAEGARDFRVSPDGTRLAFEWAVSGEPQLWLVGSEGGWPKQLTFGSGITFFEWRPNGRQLIVGRDADGNEREGYYLLSDDGEEEQLLLPLSDAFRTFGMFSTDGTRFLYSSTERNGRDFDIYLKDLDTGENRRVYEGTFGFFPSAWQPGGDLVIVSETRGEDANDVHLLNLADGKLTALFAPANASLYQEFAWLPDGSGFYMTTNVDHEFAGLAFYDLESASLRFVETPNRDIDGVSLSGDGRYLAWTENDDGYSRLHVRDLENGTDLSPPPLPAGVHRARFASGAPVLGVLTSGPSVPGDLRSWRIHDQKFSLAVQSSLGGLDPDRFVAPLSLRYPARDGVELQGLLYLPPASAVHGKPPVVVQVHGGPTAQSRPSFRMLEQYLVNNGIAVFAVNVRGSTGFGKTYARLDNQEKRLDSVRDLVDTVAFLSKRDDINTNRIAVMGGSYGGYMVNAVLGAYPGVFDAGISVVGVSDWVRALQEASPALKASDRIEYGDIREPRWQRFYADNSPINNAHLINVPLMVAHGVNDPRDPVSESDRIVQAVRNTGYDVTYMRFPDEGHSFRKRGNRVAYYRQVAEFLDRHLKSADTPAP